jgi:tetratricopeptide (TPR) repeat protein
MTRQHLAQVQLHVGSLYAELNDNAEALSYFRHATGNYEKLPVEANARVNVAICRAGAADMQAQLGQSAQALDECHKTLALLQEISTPSRDLAGAYEYLGYAHKVLATSSKTSVNEKTEHMRSARDMLRQALKVLNNTRSQHVFSAIDESYAKSLTDEMSKCETVLGKL